MHASLGYHNTSACSVFHLKIQLELRQAKYLYSPSTLIISLQLRQLAAEIGSSDTRIAFDMCASHVVLYHKEATQAKVQRGRSICLLFKKKQVQAAYRGSFCFIVVLPRLVVYRSLRNAFEVSAFCFHALQIVKTTAKCNKVAVDNAFKDMSSGRVLCERVQMAPWK